MPGTARTSTKVTRARVLSVNVTRSVLPLRTSFGVSLKAVRTGVGAGGLTAELVAVAEP
jgi:hypothetical protein